MQKLLFQIFLGVSLLLAGLPVRAQADSLTQTVVTAEDDAVQRVMTLEEVLRYAVEHNPNLQKVALNEKANEYRIKEVKSAALPQVSINGQFVDNYSIAQQVLPGEFFGQPGEDVSVQFGRRYNASASLEVNQALYNRSISIGKTAAQAAQQLYQLQTFQTKEDLVYNVSQIYLETQITGRQIELLNKNLERVDQLLRIAQAQYEEGLAKKVDLDQIKVNRTNLLTQIQQARAGRAQQLNLLKFYMGLPADQEIELAENATQNVKYELAGRLILSENTTMRLLAAQRELNELDMENIRAGYWPSLSAFFRYGLQGQNNALSFGGDAYNGFSAGSWGLNLSVPIFDGGRKSHQVQQARVRQEQLALDMEQARQSAEMQFDNANRQLEVNSALIEQQAGNMQLAEELYEVTRISYNEGVAPLTELLNAETSLNQAQSQYLTALLQFNLAELDHLKTSGQLAKMIREN